MQQRDAVFVRGLEFEASHGHTAAERRGTRRFRLNLELNGPVVVAAAASDRLRDAVDYGALCEVAVRVGTTKTFRLLEALAGAIAAEVQELYPRAAVTIEIEKLAPPCVGVPEACGVRLHVPARA
jgi:dihydroneopterin aldolase